MVYFLALVALINAVFSFVFLRKYVSTNRVRPTVVSTALSTAIIVAPYITGLIVKNLWLTVYGCISTLITIAIVITINNRRYEFGEYVEPDKKINISNHLKDVNGSPYKFD